MRTSPTRTAGFQELAHALLDAGHDMPQILDALRRSLTAALCDRCSIEVSASSSTHPPRPVVVSPRHAVLSIPSQRLLHGYVTVTRNDNTPAFEARDLADIETCIAYATLAGEVALELDAERRLLRIAHDRAEQFHRTILRVVGHDLRAPAAAILMSTEILAAHHSDDRAIVGMATRIASFANRMTRIVDQLHDLSRVQLGHGIPLARFKVALPMLVESVIHDLSKRHPRNAFSLAGEARREEMWDPDRLRQVIASLAANAVHHGVEDGPVQVSMSQDDNVTTIALHNEVRGQEIPDEALQQLFEPDRERDEDNAGVGLGLELYLARAIVEAHGGTISVESTTAGTTFRVTLPATAR
jgi:signal transduction histidine kinase